MKRYLIVLLSLSLIFGLALSALADVKISGVLRTRGEYQQNTNFDGLKSLSYENHIILGMNASVSENTKGVLELISIGGGLATGSRGSQSGNIGSGSYTWGEAGSQGVYPKGNTMLGGNTPAIGILNAYIQHTITNFGFPVTLSIGHQPAKLGNGIFFDHSLLGDDKIAVILAPTKDLTIAFATLKLYEGTGNVNDDANAYVGLFVAKSKNYNISGDITYAEDGSFGGAATTSLPAWTTYAKVFNIGMRGSLTFDNLTIRGDVEIQSGKLGVGKPSELTASGNAFLVGVDFKTDVATLTGEFASGSGGGNDAADLTNNTTNPTKFKSFITALSNVPQYTYVYNYRVKGASKGIGFSNGNGGLTNTQYIKGAIKGNLRKDLSGEAAFCLLTANQAVALNGYATKSTSLGSEFDAKVSYALGKGLTYYVEGGYLFVGDAYKNSAGTKPDSAYAIRNGIQLKF